MAPESTVDLDSFGLLNWPPPSYSPLNTPPRSFAASPTVATPLMTQTALAQDIGEKLTAVRSETTYSTRSRKTGADISYPDENELRRSLSESRPNAPHHRHIHGRIDPGPSLGAPGPASFRQRSPVGMTLHDLKNRLQYHGTASSKKISSSNSGKNPTNKSAPGVRTPSGGSTRNFWRPHFAWSAMSGERAKEEFSFPEPVDPRPVFPRKRNTISIVILDLFVVGYLAADFYYTFHPSSAQYRIFFSTGAEQGLECAVSIVVGIFSLWVIGGVFWRHRNGVAVQDSELLPHPAPFRIRNNSHSGSSSAYATGAAKKRQRKVVAFLILLGILAILPIILVAVLAILHKSIKPVAPSPLCEDLGFPTTIDLDASSASPEGFITTYPSNDDKKKLHFYLGRALPDHVAATQSVLNTTGTTQSEDEANEEQFAMVDYSLTGEFDSKHSVEILYQNSITNWKMNKITVESVPNSNKTYKSVSPSIGTIINGPHLGFPNLPNNPMTSLKTDWNIRAYSPRLDLQMIPWADGVGTNTLIRFVGDKRLGNGERVDCAPKIRACAKSNYDADDILIPAGVLLIELGKVKHACYK